MSFGIEHMLTIYRWMVEKSFLYSNLPKLLIGWGGSSLLLFLFPWLQHTGGLALSSYSFPNRGSNKSVIVLYT